MIDKSLARSAQESTTRTDRGQKLYTEHADEIRFEAKLGVWLVPSCSDLTSVYEVTLGLRPSCECKDFEFGHVCKHLYATALFAAKRRRAVRSRFARVLADEGL